MNDTKRRPLFADLVFSEEGRLARVLEVGGVSHYAVPDGDFLRHVQVEYVDRQVVAMLKERFQGMRDVITEGVVQMMGQEDLFTRASIAHAIDSMDRILDPGSVDVDELRTALWMMKFRVTVNVHGDVVRLDIPGWENGEADT